MRALRERVRWTIARILDRSPRTCWADLCTWAMLEKPGDYDLSVWDMVRAGDARAGRCRPNCWCGKNKTPEQRAKDEAAWAGRMDLPDELSF